MKEVLYFSTPTCAPCRFFWPVLSEYLEGKSDLKKIDLSEEGNFPYKDKYNLKSVPTVVFLDGDLEIGRVVGAKMDEVKKFYE